MMRKEKKWIEIVKLSWNIRKKPNIAIVLKKCNKKMIEKNKYLA